MTITLSVILSLVFLQFVLNYSLTQIKDKVDVTIYFVSGAEEEKIFSLKASLEQLPEVSSVSYLSAEDSLAAFKERYAGDYLTLQALEEIGENPLGASLNVRAQETSQYESIDKFLESDTVNAAIIDKVNYRQNKVVIDRLASIINGAQVLGGLITLILIAISILITFNTIRLTIFISREEIGIMRLVGAENRYIRGPFVIEGVIYGVVSSILTMALFFPFTYWLGKNLTGFFGTNIFHYYLGNFVELFFIALGSGVILGVISSFLAIRKYLNK